jgi:hypothetical protein
MKERGVGSLHDDLSGAYVIHAIGGSRDKAGLVISLGMGCHVIFMLLSHDVSDVDANIFICLAKYALN